MNARTLWHWEVGPDDVAAADAALARLVEHCADDHPLISRLETFHRDADGSRAYAWSETYASREDLERDHYTADCAALWQPIRDMAGDSFTGGPVSSGPGYGPPSPA